MSDVMMYSSTDNNMLSSIQSYAYKNGYKNIFFLIDTMAGSVPIGYWQLEAGDGYHWGISDSEQGDEVPLQLLCFNLQQQDVIERIIAIAQDDKQCNAICGWMFSRKTGDHLQRHLSDLLLFKYQSDDWLFRYYDPRVMGRLIAILSVNQLDDLLGIVDSWHFLNRYKNEVIIQHRAKNNFGRNLIQLNLRQWGAVSNIEWFNRTLDAYAKFDPTPLSLAQEKLLNQALIYVKRFGLTQGEDILVFAQFSLIYGGGLLSDTEIKAMVMQSIAQKRPLIDFFSQRTDEFWMSVKRITS